MILNLFSLKDIKAGVFGSVSPAVNEAIYCRSVSNEVKNPSNILLHCNPEDFDVYCVGTFDTDTGVITSDVKFVTNCVVFKENV